MKSMWPWPMLMFCMLFFCYRLNQYVLLCSLQENPVYSRNQATNKLYSTYKTIYFCYTLLDDLSHNPAFAHHSVYIHFFLFSFTITEYTLVLYSDIQIERLLITIHYIVSYTHIIIFSNILYNMD